MAELPPELQALDVHFGEQADDVGNIALRPLLKRARRVPAGVQFPFRVLLYTLSREHLYILGCVLPVGIVPAAAHLGQSCVR